MISSVHLIGVHSSRLTLIPKGLYMALDGRFQLFGCGLQTKQLGMRSPHHTHHVACVCTMSNSNPLVRLPISSPSRTQTCLYTLEYIVSCMHAVYRTRTSRHCALSKGEVHSSRVISCANPSVWAMLVGQGHSLCVCVCVCVCACVCVCVMFIVRVKAFGLFDKAIGTWAKEKSTNPPSMGTWKCFGMSKSSSVMLTTCATVVCATEENASVTRPLLSPFWVDVHASYA